MGRLKRNISGGVLVEFAISALLFFVSVLTALEWSVELYVRHATERSLTSAVQIYSTSRDLSAAQETARIETVYIVDRCLEPIKVRLFDTILDVDLTDQANGYAPTGTVSDDAAVIARIEVTCRWNRFTPFLAAIAGSEMVHTVSSYTRLR